MSDDTTHDEKQSAWQRVADHVSARIDELPLTQAEVADIAGVSEDTVNKIANCRQFGYSKKSMREVSRALGWPPDAIQRIAKGEYPQPDWTSDDEPPTDLRSGLLDQLHPDDLHRVLDLARRLHEDREQ